MRRAATAVGDSVRPSRTELMRTDTALVLPGPSNAIRNGAIAGAIIGGVATVAALIRYSDTFGDCGDDLVLPAPGGTAPPCHSSKRATMVMLTVAGIGLGTAVGTLVGGVVELAERF